MVEYSKEVMKVGLTKLSDNSFLTVLLQDHVGGLQVLHDQYWLITNGKFISVFWRMQLEHVSQWHASLVCI
ncbi:BnaC06g10420D [Brassica napus]|uniref:BnaC06g10420D protein n=1 Tax=Brassica napus TaxID=3708 RepID=A0A078H1K5_BRANA|nr:BnaC06g10420D [Brassica napus]